LDEPIRTVVNQYRGINPHLNGALQTPGSEELGLSIWPGFHSRHVTHIADFLTEQLPPHYIAQAEQSLQILTEDIEAELRSRKPRPDITIYGEAPAHAPTMVAVERGSIALDDTLDLSEDFVTAVVIRDIREDDRLGKIVARIELLSPSNKPDHASYEFYRKARNDALYSRIPLIELDYLHESPPTPMRYPIYPKQPGSHPYNIFVSDPRPSVSEGRFVPYGFDVDDSFPMVVIPLSGDETLKFDFGAVYQYTYKRGRWGMWLNLVDYSQPPLRLHTYSEADQERIRRRMATIADAHSRGLDLEQGPFPLLS
jgi:hypothetical protein